MVTVGFSAQVNAQMGISTVQETITVTGAEPDRRHQGNRDQADVHQRAAAEHSVGARPVGHPPADGRHRDGPREHRRQHVRSAVQLRVARRQPVQQQVVARRHRHHRHGRDRRVADLLRLRRVRGNDDQHRRRRRDAADRRRRHQPRDQERHRQLQGSSRFYATDEKFESQNITDAQRNQGATSGNPIQNIKDYGFEDRRPAQEGQGVDLGHLRQAAHRHRRPGLLPADRGLPGLQEPTRWRSRAIDDVNNV